MCTASWLISDESYEIFFNRDELRTRQKALPPRCYQNQDIHYIAPVDPVAGGTWISTNQFGISLCLLNNYRASAKLTPRNWISRGLLVNRVATSVSTKQVSNAINGMALNLYQPFDLLIFSLSDTPLQLSWDGIQLSAQQNPSSPLSSSSFNTSEVVQGRMAQLRLAEQIKTDTLREFHASHHPEKGAYSVCMHREDASTVSFSHISVNKTEILFRYSNGAPCKTKPSPLVSIDYLTDQMVSVT